MISSRQHGFVLIMTLVFLVLLTIIGLTAMSTTSLEEKMAGNIKDKNLAFQAAEAALITGENWIYSQIKRPEPDNSAGIYEPDSTTSTPWWESLNWNGSGILTYPNVPYQTVSGGFTKVQTQPKYIIEDMGDMPEEGGSLVLPPYKSKGKTVLRITARGTGGTDAAVVMTQSTYSRAF